MISINATLILQVIQFLLLMFILNRLMFRPLVKLIGERSDHFQKLREEIDLLEQETARLQGEIEDQEKAARKDASRARTRLRNSAMQEVEHLLGETRDKVSAIRSEADQTAVQEMEKARPLVRDQARALVEGITERLIGRRIAA